MDIFNIVSSQQSPADDRQPAAHIIVPSEGICVKLKTTKQEKVFVNICHSEKVPVPRDITDDELRSLLEDVENSPPFKIPMSIGEPHAELDAAGNGCTAYDVIVHPNLLKKVQSSELFEAFLMTVIFEGLENKYNVQLERTWVVLKNKRAMGRLQEQYVRAAPRPTIVEMGDTSGSDVNRKLIQEVTEPQVYQDKQVGDVPPYELLAVPEEGIPEYLVARITLPKLRSSRGLLLDVASDMLCLSTRSHVYAMEVVLSPHVDEESTVAEFNRDTKILTVTMPVRTAEVC
ncbi:PIH1 domain-containing protein 1 [Clonorchis sinensis]|uniref:PIH1 domain-containing protein 1 n=1 Tax=Clonorchis sinensis TaxID=79923 RepID=A0A8T1M3W6_CLOSI|nr:PIH1 domain-containing protein 1 [Clonorchis sinensis]